MLKVDPTSPELSILLANPRGFCAGVDRAISIVERALELFEPPIYVRHEVVHNRYVVENLKQRGAIFVDELEQVPDSSIVIFSAHGVSQAVRKEAKVRGLKSRFLYFPEENHWVLTPQNGIVWQREFFKWLDDTL